MKSKIGSVILWVLVCLAITCSAIGIGLSVIKTDSGHDGMSAYETWLENGHEGSESDFLNWLQGDNGQNGKDGTNGESAFDIWKVKYGDKTSTETDFLEWLKGENGKNGIDGINGIDGEAGQAGDDGKGAFEIWQEK